MKPNSRKRILTVISFFALAVTLLLGCETPHTEPLIPPVSIDVSFPDGAPPLNKTKELRVTVKTSSIPANAMSIQVNLPDSFELINGSLSWIGDIPANSQVPVVKAMVKSIKPGCSAIKVISYLDPKENVTLGGTGYNSIYILVSEKSAEWRLNPDYCAPGNPSRPPVPATQLPDSNNYPPQEIITTTPSTTRK